jgi:hypothetical protein
MATRPSFLRLDAFLHDRGAKHVTKQGLAAGRVGAPARVAAWSVNPSSEAQSGLSAETRHL